MLASAQTGVWPELSVATTEVVTVTVWPFGGQIVDGVAVTDEMTGGVVSEAARGVSRKRARAFDAEAVSRDLPIGVHGRR